MAAVVCSSLCLTPLAADADAALNAAASLRGQLMDAAQSGDFSNLPADFTPPPAVIDALRARADAGELDLSPGGLAAIAADLRAAGFDAPPPAAALAAKMALFGENAPPPEAAAIAFRSRFGDAAAAQFAAQTVDQGALAAARVDIITLRGDVAATVDPHGDGLLRFRAPLIQTPDGAAAIMTRAGVAPIHAGAVRLSTAARDAIASQAVNVDGVAQAASAAIDGGRVILRSAIPLAIAHARAGDAETAMRFRATEMRRFEETIESTGCVDVDCLADAFEIAAASEAPEISAQARTLAADGRAQQPAHFDSLNVEQLANLRLSNHAAAMSDAELRAAGGDRGGLVASILNALDRSARRGADGSATPYATRVALAGGALVYDPHGAAGERVDIAELRLPVLGGLGGW